MEKICGEKERLTQKTPARDMQLNSRLVQFELGVSNSKCKGQQAIITIIACPPAHFTRWSLRQLVENVFKPVRISKALTPLAYRKYAGKKELASEMHPRFCTVWALARLIRGNRQAKFRAYLSQSSFVLFCVNRAGIPNPSPKQLKTMRMFRLAAIISVPKAPLAHGLCFFRWVGCIIHKEVTPVAACAMLSRMGAALIDVDLRAWSGSEEGTRRDK
ncbi:hypothetical protein BX661DRAFT_186695 [Kickxella alabastrina]|uniref:uncharacterized protein n=1 Tax=Kickxella alabastrina TaxID=61397 RepID=UPI00221FC0A4|nr:uncharacterized protein BX661DRAFT_186695 [Kickxella alabastrina]KAI7823475.1 hypothetical protein BX661DRAFT_186695 [Kickxella alabastrina]